MCGFAGGAWTADGEPLTVDTLVRMTRALRHRGPDDEGFFPGLESPAVESLTAVAASGCRLGHRRLSIIDLDSGRQPLANEDDSIHVVFNGEIYNYRELRADLERQGHRFRTQTDTEVLVHLYEQHGPDFVRCLRGMFAFAIWDQPRARLMLARDRLGQKPLFYRQDQGRLLFASELKALMQVPGIDRQLDLVALDRFLTYQYVPQPFSILKGFHKLAPAHYAVFENGRLQLTRYWHPQQDGDDMSSWKPERFRAELRERLTESVRLRLRSDVPLGAFLSGGVDSTLIAALMQSLSDRPIQTFSIGFPQPKFDERQFAQLAARAIGTEHHERLVDPSALDTLPRLIWHYDEPFADSSAIPTLALSEMTRESVKVVLSGDGGDELFGGYPRYQAVRIGGVLDRMPAPLRSLMTARIWQSLPASVEQKSRRRRFKKLLEAMGQEPRRRYLRWISIFDADRRRELYADGVAVMLEEVDSAETLFEAYGDGHYRSFTQQTMHADVLTYLPGDILTKVDIASMAFGLECRSPLLDHRVVELAAQVPIRAKIRGTRGKRILTETFSDLIPPAIQRRQKMGFGVPLDHWFRDELKPLVHEVLLDQRALTRDLFQVQTIRRLVDEHIHGRWDHSARLWALLCFELWQRMYLDQPPPEQCPLRLP